VSATIDNEEPIVTPWTMGDVVEAAAIIACTLIVLSVFGESKTTQAYWERQAREDEQRVMKLCTDYERFRRQGDGAVLRFEWACRVPATD
jgi:hypothetical protein